MKKLKMKIDGMTCTACEVHVTGALAKISAENIQASYRRGEAIFELPEETELKEVRKVIEEINYKPLEIEEISIKNKTALDGEAEYDFLIIGSGSAAFAAAIKATEYGARVGMIERSIVGGTCVNIGCVPSKTLLRAGEINSLAKENPFVGLRTSAQIAELPELIKQKDELVNELRNKKYVDLIDGYGIELIKGEAVFVDNHTVEANGNKFSAKKFLIATGASPSVPPIDGIDKTDYLTSTSLLNLKEIPKRLTVIGSGFVAMELGQLFHHLGSQVTLIQRSEQLLKEYDPEIASSVEKTMSEKGITFIKGVHYKRIEQQGEIKKVYLTVNDEERIVESDQLLIATGRKPNTEKLNLSAASVEIGSFGEVKINENAQTSNHKIYAAGDVTSGPQFVYVAAYEGGVVADNAIGGLNKKIVLTAVPNVIFTNPSIASVGLTEKQAIEQGFEVKTSVLQLDAVPRALVNFEKTGVIKLVADAKSLKILGIHMVAEHAGEVIYAATLAVKFGLTVEDLKESMAPYLTMAEGLKLAALTFDKDVSKLSCCAV